MLTVLKFASYAGSALALLLLVTGFPAASGAPQEAVVAALAAAIAIIPYTASATAQRARLIRLAERTVVSSTID